MFLGKNGGVLGSQVITSWNATIAAYIGQAFQNEPPFFQGNSHRDVLQLLQQLTFSRTMSLVEPGTPEDGPEEPADAVTEPSLGNLETLLQEDVRTVDA